MEHLWIEVPGRNKYSKAQIGVIYRSERVGLSPSDWLDTFETLLAHLTVSWDGLLLLIGDTNIDMLKPSDSYTKQHQSILDAFRCHQHVTKPTRITRTSKTLIDHIFNLYVADLRSELQCDCYQYADDTTFYIHSKPCDLDSSANHINKAVSSLRDYSKSCNLALNSSKTNWMLISTPQMARYHSLEERKLPIACGDNPLKLLCVYVDQHRNWKTHGSH